MSVTIRKVGEGRYKVSTPSQTHAKSTTLAKAKAQERLLNAVEHTNWRPTKKRRTKKRPRK